MLLDDYIGRTETREERLSVEPSRALADLFDLDDRFEDGDTLPPMWYWLYFLPRAPQSEIGTDGHPKLGKFLPDTGLPRRMFAGATSTFKKPLRIGGTATKRSTIKSIEEKSGKRSGRMVFVVVEHEISDSDGLCLTESQTIVYRGASTQSPSTSVPTAEPLPPLLHQREVTPDPVMLFRFSALTYNAHRIHYDRQYATEEEGYSDLVVHGPLTALLLISHFQQRYQDKKIRSFSFRGTSPFFVSRHMTLGITHDSGTPDRFELTAFDNVGVVGQQAHVIVA